MGNSEHPEKVRAKKKPSIIESKKEDTTESTDNAFASKPRAYYVGNETTCFNALLFHCI